MVACISDRIAHIHDFTGIDLPLCRFEVCSAILVDVYIAACVTASQCQKNVSDISIRFKERQIYSNHKNQWEMLLFNPLKAEQCAHCVCVKLVRFRWWLLSGKHHPHFEFALI